jgi:hypothetical protein
MWVSHIGNRCSIEEDEEDKKERVRDHQLTETFYQHQTFQNSCMHSTITIFCFACSHFGKSHSLGISPFAHIQRFNSNLNTKTRTSYKFIEDADRDYTQFTIHSGKFAISIDESSRSYESFHKHQ